MWHVQFFSAVLPRVVTIELVIQNTTGRSRMALPPIFCLWYDVILLLNSYWVRWHWFFPRIILPMARFSMNMVLLSKWFCTFFVQTSHSDLRKLTSFIAILQGFWQVITLSKHHWKFFNSRGYQWLTSLNWTSNFLLIREYINEISNLIRSQ